MSDKKEEKKETATTDRLATVVDFFESGAAKVRFDGEDKDSEKEYPFMKHCIPTKGDRVYMRAFAESYIIEGVILFETAPQKLDGVDSDFNVKGKLKASSAEISGNVNASNFNGNVTGNVTGSLNGNVTGNVKGNVNGNVTGSLNGNVTGNVRGNVNGNVTGSLNGNVTGNVRGDVTGNVKGNVTGTLYGSVQGGSVSASSISSQGNISTNNTVSCGTLTTNNINCSNFRTSNYGVGFFGTTPSRKQSIYGLNSNSDLNTVINRLNSLLSALRGYGLIS
jgi:hypothetical protein